MSRRGSVCISVLHTGDVDRAATFYESLLGWTVLPVQSGDGRFRFLQWHGDTVAAIHGSPTLNEWVPHVSVDDGEVTTASAVALGGEVVSRDAVAEVVRLTVLRDREGARFGLWQPSPLEGATLTDVVGSLWWAEVLSDNPLIAKEFYSSLFGWSTPRDRVRAIQCLHSIRTSRRAGGWGTADRAGLGCDAALELDLRRR
jgi:uncharacterized protein